MRKKNNILHDNLLACARDIADTEGIEAVNIRTIAQRTGVAIGTIYNYFSNKDEILLALTEEYWRQTLSDMQAAVTADSFSGQLEEMIEFLKERIDCSAGKLMHSIVKVEPAGMQRMMYIQAELEEAVIRRMERDINVRSDIWSETFTKQQFVRFLMMNIMMLLKTKTSDKHFFIEIVKRTIY